MKKRILRVFWALTVFILLLSLPVRADEAELFQNSGANTLMEALPEEFLKMTEERGESKERIVCDYIAGMTDNYAVKKFQEYFVPESWKF